MSNSGKQPNDLSELSGLAPKLAVTFASIASDIALVIDADGIILNVSFGGAPMPAIASDWVGRPWIDTVTPETRAKIEQLLAEVSSTGVAKRREVNHPAATGGDVPMAYAAIRLGVDGPVLAAGRDMRAIAAIQQRFIQSQQEMERDYWKTRQAESRYRMLFQAATDGVLVVDALSLKVVEANRAASQLFNLPLEKLVGHEATVGVDRHSRPALEELFAIARSTGKPAEIRVRLAETMAPISVSATPFRAESEMLFLLRARAIDSPLPSTDTNATLAGFVERTPDAVVITDSSGRVIMANPAFIDLCQLSDEAQVRGRMLGDAVGDNDDKLTTILGEVRRHGIATQVGAAFTVAKGIDVSVDISAALLAEGDQECVGFTIRRAVQRGAELGSMVNELRNAMGHLASLVGQGSLPDMLVQVAHIAERQMIETAMAQAGGNISVAAACLGISDDNLELRMGRLGLDEDAATAYPPRPLVN